MLKVADVMTTKIFSVSPETSIHDVARLMSTKHISGVPVIDREKRVVGVLSEGNLIRHAAMGGEPGRSWWETLFSDASSLARDYVRTHGHRAGEVMTAGVITIDPAASVAECASIMNRHRIKRVLVFDKDELVGIVTRGDLLRAVATVEIERHPTFDDGAIRARLVSELEGQRWAHLLGKNIVVRNGVIDISGFVESEDERHALRVAAQNVPGVKGVQDHATTRQLFRLG